MPSQVSRAPSLGFIIWTGSDPEHSPRERVASPAPAQPPRALPMLAGPPRPPGAPGDGWHVLILPGQKSHQHGPPLMLSWYFQRRGEQEAQGCGKTKQGS